MTKSARGSLLGIEYLRAEEIVGLLKLARRMNPQKTRPLLRGKRVLLLFYEPSTRTRSSFEIAATSLGAITTLVQSSGSSIEKGESLLDTGYTLHGLGADVIVIRHPNAGAPLLMAQHLDIPVINAGDGMHEHPSQALLDAYTIVRHKKALKGLQDYIARYQVTMVRLKLAKKDALLMHPGPIIRGLELTGEVADCPQSVIVEEVRNGVPVRMAILARALGRAR